MCLPKFDIYQGILASNCFKTHTNSWCPSFFQKKVLSNVRPQIALFFIFTINIVNLIYLRILWMLKIWRLLQKIRKKLGESFLLTQWNTIRNDNTSSQKVLFFLFFFSGATLPWKIKIFEKTQNLLNLPHYSNGQHDYFTAKLQISSFLF